MNVRRPARISSSGIPTFYDCVFLAGSGEEIPQGKFQTKLTDKTFSFQCLETCSGSFFVQGQSVRVPRDKRGKDYTFPEVLEDRTIVTYRRDCGKPLIFTPCDE